MSALPPIPAELARLASHMSARRSAVLKAWRDAVFADPTLTTGASLPRAQLHDHIPSLLEDFERQLHAEHAGGPSAGVQDLHLGDAAAHGLHRWQQGFDLAEVTRELGRLNEVVLAELDRYHAENEASVSLAAMATARRVWAHQASVAICASTMQFFKLQQIEASSHIRDLERALDAVRSLETQRAELWQQAAHDLRGNLGVVATASAGLSSAGLSEDVRPRFIGLLDRNVRALHDMLDDVTSLARLQGGLEHRTLEAIDVAPLLRDLCEALHPLAEARRLTLHVEGPASLPVMGDAVKIRRIAQNLVLNALRYTLEGSVLIRWGDSSTDDTDRWLLEISDTGPGFHAGPESQLADAIEIATDQARASADARDEGDVQHLCDDVPEASALPAATESGPARLDMPGEGIGLSIVKRLCALLDATVELESEVGMGTRYRIRLPRVY
jgi:signal transduction histidine kinase